MCGPSLPDLHGTKRPSFVTSAEEQSLSMAVQGLSGEAEQSWAVTPVWSHLPPEERDYGPLWGSRSGHLTGWQLGMCIHMHTFQQSSSPASDTGIRTGFSLISLCCRWNRGRVPASHQTPHTGSVSPRRVLGPSLGRLQVPSPPSSCSSTLGLPSKACDCGCPW